MFSIILLYLASGPERVYAQAQSNCSLCKALDGFYREVVAGQDVTKAASKVGSGLRLRCVNSPDAPNAVGVVQQLRIAAPLEKVLAVLDDFAGYRDLFPDVKKVESRPGPESGVIDVTWTEAAPVFFMANPVHEIRYRVESQDKRKIYRTGLIKSRHLKYSEGLIVVAAIDEKSTLYTEIDFLEADSSFLKILAPDLVWNKMVRPLAQSDLALKFKAENSDLNGKAARDKADRDVDAASVKECVGHRVAFSRAAVTGPF